MPLKRVKAKSGASGQTRDASKLLSCKQGELGASGHKARGCLRTVHGRRTGPVSWGRFVFFFESLSAFFFSSPKSPCAHVGDPEPSVRLGSLEHQKIKQKKTAPRGWTPHHTHLARSHRRHPLATPSREARASNDSLGLESPPSQRCRLLACHLSPQLPKA